MNKLQKIAHICFYIALTIELILVVLERSVYIIQYSGQWFRLTFALFLFKLILTKYTRREMIAIAGAVLLGVISYLCTGANEVIRFVIMVAACKNINYDRMFKWIFAVWAIGFGICILLSFFGVGIFKISTDFRGMGIETRYALGLGHPNTLHGMVWLTITALLYAMGEQIKIWQLIAVMGVNTGLFLITTSRTAFILITLQLILTFLAIKYKGVYESKMFVYGFAGLLVLGLVFTCFVMYPPMYYPYHHMIDSKISGRMMATYFIAPECRLWEMLPFATFGREPESDLGIAKMIAWFGYIPTLFYIFMNFKVCNAMRRNKDYLGVAILTVFFVSSITESHIVNFYLATNIVVFLFGKYWTDILDDKKEDTFLWDVIRRGDWLSNNV